MASGRSRVAVGCGCRRTGHKFGPSGPRLLKRTVTLAIQHFRSPRLRPEQPRQIDLLQTFCSIGACGRSGGVRRVSSTASTSSARAVARRRCRKRHPPQPRWQPRVDRVGRSGGIRTHDPQSPRLMRYQTALRSDCGGCSSAAPLRATARGPLRVRPAPPPAARAAGRTAPPCPGPPAPRPPAPHRAAPASRPIAPGQAWRPA